MPTKVVVTGGAGFIGSHLVDALTAAGHQVVIVDDLSSGKRSHVAHAELVVADIRDRGVLEEHFESADCVFHLAAKPRVQYSIRHPDLTHSINVNGTESVLEAARHAKVRRVVFASSSSIYGERLGPFTEDMAPYPMSPYALHKWVGEQYCEMYSSLYGLQTVCLRLFNVYGPRFDPEGEDALVIGKFLNQRKRGEPLTIAGSGQQTRDFTHVFDVVRAFKGAMMVPIPTADAVILNIGAGRPVSINYIAKLIGGPTVPILARKEPMGTWADNLRAQACMEWQPHIPIEAGIADLKCRLGIL